MIDVVLVIVMVVGLAPAKVAVPAGTPFGDQLAPVVHSTPALAHVVACAHAADASVKLQFMSTTPTKQRLLFSTSMFEQPPADGIKLFFQRVDHL
ncbi:hypothetical protein [Bradyrhizobium sp. dw_78]|uniref:hypothetical protein n=1 Tax=Bradyrhizobium sp. dw_78 TaxID=2719793 RepID=UPI001BD4C20C|nr:hypothetical protein [Bradyrhizobium sp. dw_78]